MCPNINLLKTYKVYPRKLSFNYMTDRFFVYVYIDPFQPLKKPMAVKVQNKKYCFAFNPIYVGKGTGGGYRQNQHIADFLNNKNHNPKKRELFQKIQEGMADAVAKDAHQMPWNWKEYQNNYIIILETFNTAVDLLNFEVALINQLGTVFDKTGPLGNKIKNATKYDFAKRTGNGQVL